MRRRDEPASWFGATEPAPAGPPRVAAPSEVAPETQELLAKTVLSAGQEPLNIFRTLAVNPGLLKRVNVYSGFFIARGTLSPRIRELLILRVACRVDCRYEWQQHMHLAHAAGLTDADVGAVEQGLLHPWAKPEAAALALADDLLETDDVSQRTWEDATTTGWTDAQLVEMIMLVGSYRMVAGFLRGARIPVDDRLAPDLSTERPL